MINIYRSKDGQFYFTVTAKNGRVVSVSEMYVKKSNAKQGAIALKKALSGLLEFTDHTIKTK